MKGAFVFPVRSLFLVGQIESAVPASQLQSHPTGHDFFLITLYFMKHFLDNTSVRILFYEFIHTGFNGLDLDGQNI